MKSHINLIARETLYEGKVFPFKKAAPLILVASVVMVFVFLSGWYIWQERTLRNEVQRLEAQRAKVQQEMARINGKITQVTYRTQASHDIVEQQLAAIKDLRKKRILWSDMVREISFIVPKRVWLTRVESFDSKKDGLVFSRTGKSVRFIGFARSQDAVNFFLSALERSPRYEGVSLVYAQKRGEKNRERVDFELTVGLF